MVEFAGGLKRLLLSLFPILCWLPRYKREYLVADFIAGWSMGMVAIPTCLAYSETALIPPEYSIYTAIAPGLVYSVFGTSKDLSMGPTVSMALFLARFNPTHNSLGASFMALLVGGVLFSMAVFRLGIVTRYVPSLVISAFMSATAVIVIINETSKMFGIRKNSANIFARVYDFFRSIDETNVADLLAGGTSVLFLAVFTLYEMHGLKRIKHKSARKLVQIICAAKNVFLCIVATVVVFVLTNQYSMTSITLSGYIPNVLPPFRLPIANVRVDNSTHTPSDFIEGFGLSLVVLPIVQFIQMISISSSFAQQFEYTIRPNQELLALSLSNLIGSLFGGYPSSGSFSRSAIGAMSGSRTPLAGAFASCVIVLALKVMTPAFYYIPKPTLSAMLIVAVTHLIDYKVIGEIWRVEKLSLLTYAVTFIGSLIRLEVGVIAGTLVAIVILLSKEVRPGITHVTRTQTNARLAVKNLSYPGLTYLKDKLQEIFREDKLVYVDVSEGRIDYELSKGLEKIQDELSNSDKVLRFWKQGDEISSVVKESDCGEEMNLLNHVLPSTPDNMI